MPLNDAGLRNEVLDTSADNFAEIALKVFNFQYQYNETYRLYCDLLKKDPKEINTIEKIPFLPIRFFKTKEIKTTTFKEELLFESSTTTGMVPSRHFIKEKTLYEESFLKFFRQCYGDEKKLCIIGLLPSYLERGNSSLVYMVQQLITRTGNAHSGFYLYEHDQLKEVLLQNEAAQQPTLLIGVTYALIDFAEKNYLHLNCTTVMETGGMKGRREELTRRQIHEILTARLGVKNIHSEYGMTELLSQAYSPEDGIFVSPPWMRVLVRSEDDPFEIKGFDLAGEKGIAGGINIIDLANLYSCAFIATDDAGKIYSDNHFEISGRLENSDIRGCSLLSL